MPFYPLESFISDPLCFPYNFETNDLTFLQSASTQLVIDLYPYINEIYRIAYDLKSFTASQLYKYLPKKWFKNSIELVAVISINRVFCCRLRLFLVIILPSFVIPMYSVLYDIFQYLEMPFKGSVTDHQIQLYKFWTADSIYSFSTCYSWIVWFLQIFYGSLDANNF